MTLERLDLTVPELPELGHIQGLFSDMVIQLYEKTLKELLRQYLGREPEVEDGKLITIGRNPNWDYELIAINGIEVGRVKFEYNGPSVTCTFIPNKTV